MLRVIDRLTPADTSRFLTTAATTSHGESEAAAVLSRFAEASRDRWLALVEDRADVAQVRLSGQVEEEETQGHDLEGLGKRELRELLRLLLVADLPSSERFWKLPSEIWKNSEVTPNLVCHS
jgi:hypothetical protein